MTKSIFSLELINQIGVDLEDRILGLFIYEISGEFFQLSIVKIMSALCSIPGGPLTELAECKCSFSDIYQTSELANALHQIPHLNYLFQHVSSNFTYSTEYAQGVAFWAVCFIALYIFLMVHLLLYSICMCRMVRKSRNTGWLKWNGKPNICLTIFGVLSFIGLAVCAVGIWSDIEQNKTLVNFVDVFKSVNNLISTLDTGKY